MYIPQVSDECNPKPGQEFLSLDEVHEFYKAYAKETKFSVRLNSSKRSMHNGEILKKKIIYSKEGTTSIEEISERKRQRGMTQEGSNAKLTAIKSKSGGYVMKKFVEGHTHTLTTPRRVHLLR
ncbi:hypothetical protein Ddye_015611 [Dipteronia dyeriana]|uniref:FAR1 domain-containing protein n=1 Tax=Dipteronia dyeriana TaxID=168575 RepID=A0AAD9WZG2_9ROSI|nr:hypothetical protein Ddye_015611 [Dipteronia dyeriana]